MTLLALCWIGALTQAQEPPPDKTDRLEGVRLWDGGPRVQPGLDPTSLDIEKPAAGTKGEFVVAPIPVYDPTVGAGLTAGVGYLFPSSGKTPPSAIGGGLFYSQNGSWAAAGGGKFYIDEGDWIVTAGGGVGTLYYELAGIGSEAGKDGRNIDLSVNVRGFLLEGQCRVFSDLYAGLRFVNANVRTNIDSEDEDNPISDFIPEEERGARVAAPGLHFQWDERDSTFYPTTGLFIDLRADFFDPAFGSEFDYQVYALAANSYHTIGPDHVLALRAFLRMTFGEVPFFALSYLGRIDLRGYPLGSYQDRMLLAVQGEWRWRFAERFVLAAFSGVGQVAPDVDEFSGEHWLPSLGAGLRYTIAPENKVSLRLDVAVGRDDYAFYFSVGEAF